MVLSGYPHRPGIFPLTMQPGVSHTKSGRSGGEKSPVPAGILPYAAFILICASVDCSFLATVLLFTLT
jgi:hypothetical protein